ncbi:ribosome maturation factor RimP [Demequina salsinemoris]|uniref:ribosome maturation factor RimP n=1 Tax=Demequina salsinemoris TaxID=577470 RepID=UPI0007837B40|nr:hypothetical protein [Demequina salsinemoris]
MDITERIVDLAAPAAEAAGLVIDSVEVHRAGKRSRVVVTVDLPETEIGSAGLDAVAEASRSIGKALDEADPIKGEYMLEVSTPGTSRPLTERRHFLRARTRLVVIDLASGDQARGRITDVTDDAVLLDGDAGEVTVPFANIARGSIEVELKRIDDAELTELADQEED